MTPFRWLSLLLASILYASSSVDALDAIPDWLDGGQCQRIDSVTLCNGREYNDTLLPNKFGHNTQREASLEINQYVPLIQHGCSPELRFFLCATYLPACLPNPVTNSHVTVQPCREMCLRVRRDCEDTVVEWGFTWPAALDCTGLQSTTINPNAVCFSNFTGAPTNLTDTKVDSGVDEPVVNVKHSSCWWLFTNNSKARQDPWWCVDCEYDEEGETEEQGFYFTKSQQSFMKAWLGVWSVLCFISTLFTVITFIMDQTRYAYPERPIIYLSVCYMFYSLGFIIRLGAGDKDVACSKDGSIEVLIKGDANYAGCTVIFMILYFSFMAASAWWVILTLTWFLAAGMKWGNEAIEGYALYYHLVAWLIPLIKTIVALILQKVDGDELSRVCFVGAQDPPALAGFVLAPLCIYLILGTTFIISGFTALFRIREVIKHDRTRSDKLEKLMIRIGVFSVLYTVPATIVVGCYFYEYFTRDLWAPYAEVDYLDITEVDRHLGGGSILRCHSGEESCQRAAAAVFYVKYLMSLIVGVTSGVWIWSGKTVASWKKFVNVHILRVDPRQHPSSETTV
ncbi:frizzled-9-like [Corticium candelabrum]|uniref:frizzled-9-like n=1 Tax=Corticium candelabrum TaxID=121492 RepID=UPI002E2644A2|nr:frizzled-9-like [Corticium candelabrum]